MKVKLYQLCLRNGEVRETDYEIVRTVLRTGGNISIQDNYHPLLVIFQIRVGAKKSVQIDGERE